MRPLKLTLTGFIGVRDGMRRDGVTLDLQSLPAGLIALSGRNGSGKTTLMDNLHPYRIMPSQASKLSVDSFSYWDHIYGAKAEKVLEWEHAGRCYRSTFSFRKTGKTGKADYYLTVQDAQGQWSPVTLPDGRTSDGKAEDYDRCVEAVCGSLEQFFTSVFSAQSRRPLASYNVSEIKSLLAELLRVDELQKLAAKAGDVAKNLQRRLDATQQEVLLFTSKRDRLSQTTQAIEADGQALVLARSKRETLASQAATLGQQRATLAAKQAESKTVEARLRELTQRRAEVTAQVNANASEEKASSQRFLQRRTAISRTMAAHQATLAQEPAIKAATAQREDAQLRISRSEARVGELQKVVKALEDTPVTMKQLEAEVHSLGETGRAKKVVLMSFKQQADDFNRVPCGQTDLHRSCPLYRQAGEAREKYDVQYLEIKTLHKTFVEKDQKAKSLLPEVSKLRTARVDLETATAELAKAQRDLQTATDLAARAPLIQQAREGLAACESDLKQLEGEATDAARLLSEQATRLGNQLQQISAEVARLGAVDVAAEIAALERQLQANRDESARVDGGIEALIRSQATRQAEAEAMKTALVGCDATQALANQLSNEIAKWKLLSKGLGNDGVIALTIDDAGPALTQMVNDLLLACYGRRFTVEIRTQKTLANGELREGFEILVHDADNNSTKTVGVMSGGQKVWINECLTRGIALYIAHVAGQPYATLFTDEADGPLDPEKKRQFILMKREVLKQGGYEREFFITHTPELLEDADAVVDVEALAA